MSQSFTFNSNNNYQVDLVNESDTDNPTAFDYTSSANIPFVEIKITPTNPQTNPVLASNLTFNSLTPYFQWVGMAFQPPTCSPYETPHETTSSLMHTNSYIYPSTCGTTNFMGSTNEAWQGPYHLLNDPALRDAEIASIGVSWKEIILIEVYEDDNGDLVNDDHTPAIDDAFQQWRMWEPLSRVPLGGSSPTSNDPPITTNVYPKYVKAFVYLQFHPTGLFSNAVLNIDVDEVEPTYGCTDPNANNYDINAQVDDLSCILPAPTYNIIAQDRGFINSNPPVYFDPPAFSQTPAYSPVNGFNTYDISGLTRMPKNLQIGNGATPGTVTSTNSYEAGEYVSETMEIIVYQRRQTFGTGSFITSNGVTTEITGQAIAAWNFPITSPNSSPDAQDFTTPITFFGDAQANLTAANLSILNYNPDEGATVMRSAYVPLGTSGNYSSNTSLQPQWVPDGGYVDEDGLVPRTIVEWYTEDLDCTQLDGSIFTVGTDGMWAEEVYTGSNTTITNYPGLEWFPTKIKLFVNLSFVMPAHDVYLTLDLQHDTRRTDHQFL